CNAHSLPPFPRWPQASPPRLFRRSSVGQCRVVAVTTANQRRNITAHTLTTRHHVIHGKAVLNRGPPHLQAVVQPVAVAFRGRVRERRRFQRTVQLARRDASNVRDVATGSVTGKLHAVRAGLPHLGCLDTPRGNSDRAILGSTSRGPGRLNPLPLV